MQIKLWENTPCFDASLGQEEPYLVPYIVEGADKCVIVCPGGAYAFKADHEGGPIAEALNARGISAFVLMYRVAPYRHPVPLGDAQRAVRYARANAAKYGYSPDKIAILGFSAGGHLACAASNIFDGGDPDAEDPIDRVSCRPDASVLCYAVISGSEYRHKGSFENLLGGDGDTPSARAALSGEYIVSGDTPPAFIWATYEDDAVPVMNSMRYALALQQQGIPYALHVYTKGPHGIGLGGEYTARTWTGLCADWLYEMLP